MTVRNSLKLPAKRGGCNDYNLVRPNSSSPETKDFISGFAKKAGYPADMVAASGHTALLVVADALKGLVRMRPQRSVMPFQKRSFRRLQVKSLSTHWVRFKKMSGPSC